MNAWWKIGLIAAVCAAIWGYGKHEYNSGYGQSQLENKADVAVLEKKYRDKEIADQAEADRKFQEYKDAKKATDDANTALTATTSSLRNQIALYKRRLSKTASNPAGTIATGEIGIDLFAECTDRYASMGKEAGRLADKVNALIGQVQQ